MTENNMDVLINRLSYNIAKEAKEAEIDNYLDKLLGVLMNDGVYAYYIYCKAQKGKSNSNNEPKENSGNKNKGKKTVKDVFVDKVITSEEGKNLISALNLPKNENVESFFENLPQNLDQLLLFRSVLERILIYARYHLKAMDHDVKAMDHDGGNAE